MQAFQSMSPNVHASIAADYLGLAMVEWTAIAGEPSQAKPASNELWGYPNNSSDWITELQPVRKFLARSGLCYQDITELIRLRYINPFESLIIDVDEKTKKEAEVNGSLLTTCDTTKLKIYGLDEPSLTRIHRFVRLWRKLGWTMRELDQALCALAKVPLVGSTWDCYVRARDAISNRLRIPDPDWWSLVKTTEHLHRDITDWLKQQTVFLDNIFNHHIVDLQVKVEELIHQQPSECKDLCSLFGDLKEISTNILNQKPPEDKCGILEKLAQVTEYARNLLLKHDDLLKLVAGDMLPDLSIASLLRLAELVLRSAEYVTKIMGSAGGQMKNYLTNLSQSLSELINAIDKTLLGMGVSRDLMQGLIQLNRSADEKINSPSFDVCAVSTLANMVWDVGYMLMGKVWPLLPHPIPASSSVLNNSISSLQSASDKVFTSVGLDKLLATNLCQMECTLSSLAQYPLSTTADCLAKLAYETHVQQLHSIVLPSYIKAQYPQQLISKVAAVEADIFVLLHPNQQNDSLLAAVVDLDVWSQVGKTLGPVSQRLLIELTEKARTVMGLGSSLCDEFYSDLGTLISHVGLEQQCLTNLLALDPCLTEISKQRQKTVSAGILIAVLRRVDVLLQRDATNSTLGDTRQPVEEFRKSIADVLANLSLGNSGLLTMAQIQRLHRDLNLSVAKILSWCAPLDTYEYVNDAEGLSPSFYDQIYWNPTTKRGAPTEDDPFKLNELRSELERPDRWLIEDSIQVALSSALHVTAAELYLLVSGQVTHTESQDITVIRPVISQDCQLTLDNLSRLYRHVSLSRALRLSISDYLRIQALSGIDPFVPNNSWGIRSGNAFIDAVGQIRAPGVGITELDYLLRHVSTGRAALADESIALTLQEIQTGLRQIAQDTTFAANMSDLNGELTRQKLALLGWDSLLIDRTIATLNETVIYEEPLNLQPSITLPNDTGTYEVGLDALPPITFPLEIVKTIEYDREAKVLRFAHPMTPGERNLLLGLSRDPAYQNAIEELFRQPDELKGRVTYDADRHVLQFVGAMTLARRDKLLSVPLSDPASHYRETILNLFQAPRQFIARYMRRFVEQDFAVPLAILPKDLLFPDPLREKIYFDPNAYQLHCLGAMTDLERDVLLVLSSKVTYQQAVIKLYRLPGEVLCFGEPLDIPPTSLHIPDPIKEKITYDDQGKVLYCVGRMTNIEREQVLHSSTEPTFQRAIDNLYTASQTDDSFLTPAEASLFFDTRLDAEGLLITPEKRFNIVLQRLMSYLRPFLSERLVKQKVAGALKLEMQTVSDLLTRWIPSRTEPGRKAIFDFLSTSFVESNPKVKLSRTVFRPQFDTFTLLYKIGALIAKFEITPKQLGWLFLYGPSAGWLNLDTLPLVPSDSSTAAFAGWCRIVDLFRLRDALPQGETVLDDIFSRAWEARGDQGDVFLTLNKQTGWSLDELHFLSSTLDLKFPADFRDERVLLRLYNCFALMRRVGASAVQCRNWAKTNDKADALTIEDANSARQAVKARYSDDQWIKVIKTPTDRLREKRRDALDAYLVANPPLVADSNPLWRDLNDLYAYFLIDIEMSSSMLTSRIKQACGSVQLFVQRCLMNLESQVRVDTAEHDEKWLEWQWMKNYRVWEANRKIFLFPENWIEPELRDDKSPFFKELENELLQGEINDQTAEAAFRHYLEKLDQVARSEICAVWNEFGEGDQVDYCNCLHVVARTAGTPRTYYYRRCFDRQLEGKSWTAWEKVDLDIDEDGGAHLVLTMWNQRLFLFWLTFKKESKEQPLNISVGKNVSDPLRVWQVHLAWSEYRNGRWSPKRLSKGSIEVDIPPAPSKGLIAAESVGWPFIRNFVSYFEGFQELSIKTFCDNWNHMSAIAQGEFRFSDCNDEPECSRSDNLEMQNNHRWDGNSVAGLSEYQLNKNITLVAGPMGFRLSSWGIIEPQDPQKESFSWPLPIFLADSRRTFYIDKTYTSYFIQAFYHPYLRRFIGVLNRGGITGGINGLLRRQLQCEPSSTLSTILGIQPEIQPLDFASEYLRNTDPAYLKGMTLPVENIDFSEIGSYALYNWELFFHVPLLIADRLSKNQRFEEAMKWFHYIFNPTDTSPEGDEPQKHYWQTKPFFERSRDVYDAQQIQNLLELIAQGGGFLPEEGTSSDLFAAIGRWRRDPFKPHLIARTRKTAFQKTVVMKYIENLIAWADQLFRRDTIESINEATQLYILASEILGRRPEILKPRYAPKVNTYYSMESKMKPGDFSDPLVEAEHFVPLNSAVGTGSATSSANSLAPQLLLFGVPKNDRLFGYWDTVADRLFKVRHGLNIEGVARSLALFEPPIDPALLVKAAAAGIDISSVLGDINTPLPYYRFNIMLQKAVELCSEVRALGTALLAALEKGEAEELALLRSKHEISILDAVRQIKQNQADETQNSLESLQKSKEVIQIRKSYYEGRDFTNAWENAHLTGVGAALLLRTSEAVALTLAGGLHLIPNVKIGAPTTMGAETGGDTAGQSATKFGTSLGTIATLLESAASMSATLGGYKRRKDEWDFQKDIATKEDEQIDKQILAADIRYAIAQKELENHDLQVDNAKEVDDLMHSKFTNQELYDWMVGQISVVYFQSYQLVYDVAKRAERAYRFELGLQDSNFIQFGYWDSLKKGLLAGEKLSHDLKRMEMAYLDRNKREYEVTKHISLAQIAPIDLLKLKETGQCFVDLPESLFEMDNPGNYMRRIKSVGVSIPCVTGPYTSVNCTLTLLKNSIRVNTSAEPAYERQQDADDPRFWDNLVAIQSIVISHGQNDSGLFETNLRDERYLPFEGSGVISTWRLELPKDIRQFDYNTISDVILHLRYTARDGGEPLKKGAIANLITSIDEAQAAGSVRLFSIRHEFPTEWARFKNMKPGGPLSTTIELKEEHFPFWSKGIVKAVKEAGVLAKGNADGITVTDSNGEKVDLEPFQSEVWAGKLQKLPEVNQKPLSIKFDLVFNSKNMEDLWLVVKWSS